jgi:hypothetical protein
VSADVFITIVFAAIAFALGIGGSILVVRARKGHDEP